MLSFYIVAFNGTIPIHEAGSCLLHIIAPTATVLHLSGIRMLCRKSMLLQSYGGLHPPSWVQTVLCRHLGLD